MQYLDAYNQRHKQKKKDIGKGYVRNEHVHMVNGTRSMDHPRLRESSYQLKSSEVVLLVLLFRATGVSMGRPWLQLLVFCVAFAATAVQAARINAADGLIKEASVSRSRKPNFVSILVSSSGASAPSRSLISTPNMNTMTGTSCINAKLGTGSAALMPSRSCKGLQGVAED